MMLMKTYESPTVELVELNLRDTIAETTSLLEMEGGVIDLGMPPAP